MAEVYNGGKQSVMDGSQNMSKADVPAPSTDYAGALADMPALVGEAREAYARSKGLDPKEYQNYINKVYAPQSPQGAGNSGNASGSGASANAPVPSTEPGDVKTTYVDANGNEVEGINRNGKTLDKNGNEIQGGFTVKTADGSYWQKNADGTSTKLDPNVGAATFGKARAKSSSVSQSAATAEEMYGGATGGGYSNGRYNWEDATLTNQNPNKGYDASGKYRTTIYGADGKTYNGYIYNGHTYYDNGDTLADGDKVVLADGSVATMDRSKFSQYNPDLSNAQSDKFKEWLATAAEGKDAFALKNDYEGFLPQYRTDKYGQDVSNGAITMWPDGSITISDGFQNVIGRFDSAGTWHPNSEENVGKYGYMGSELAASWENAARNWFKETGYQFTGDGSEWRVREHYPVSGGEEKWLNQHDYLTELYPDYVFVANLDQLKTLPAGTKVYWYGSEELHPDSDIPSGLIMRGRGNMGAFVSGDTTGTSYDFSRDEANEYRYEGTGGIGGYHQGGSSGTGSSVYPTSGMPRSTAVGNLTDQVTQGNAQTSQAIDALNNLVAAYGNDFDGLRQRLMSEYGTTDLDSIRAMLEQNPATELNLNYDTSDAYKEAEGIYKNVISDDNKPTLNFEEPNRDYEEYSPTDYTVEINDIYDKKQAAAIQAIKDQLEIGELDIDHAIEKLPGIYESGMNDMSTQFEMNKRNANEYFAANGLTSGAKAQALLAMNNVYQTNMSAYRLEQANAQAEYEHERTKLKMESQAAITEAIMQNDTERASALLAEYQRQDEYNFKYFLEKIEQDYKYWAQQCQNEIARVQTEQDWLKFQGDAAMQIMQLEEDRRYKENQQRIQAAEFAEQQRQFTIQTGLDLAKLEESIRQNKINTELSIAELAQKDGQFKINAQLTIAELAEKMRQFGIDTSISLAKLAEQQREFDINAAMSQAELQEKIREFTENLKLQNAELDLKKYQIDTNTDLTLRELQEKARQADMNYDVDMAKIAASGKKTTGSGSDTPPVTNNAYTDLSAIAADILNIQANNDNYYDDGMDDAEVASKLVSDFLTKYKSAGWTEDMVWNALAQLGIK